ncbi:DUF4266 domain-containing protein [Aggregatimonas sangjinii]|uniref:DUF4266 domain-containing protein n=1 Tax=Aggregatimonas sangjinii TaxID=2583587 RepID=A0A5B7SY52_9FLAO|nr:DUF4266 domain-containing protein [Aggregatimonas sangjinii]QCX01680.1 DUF4266 domain-containing protein [Aggregatimonas sangjinii]
MRNKILLFAMVTCLMCSCMVVKEYEKVAINDRDMILGEKPCDRNVTTMHSYREAAVGANGGKTGGGCGCN